MKKCYLVYETNFGIPDVDAFEPSEVMCFENPEDALAEANNRVLKNSVSEGGLFELDTATSDLSESNTKFTKVGQCAVMKSRSLSRYGRTDDVCDGYYEICVDGYEVH